jgi:uncharacterized YccA/Bax inhibitor family protein
MAAFEFAAATTSSPLQFSVSLDGDPVWQGQLGIQFRAFCVNVDNDRSLAHRITLEMQGKQPADTVIDTHGKIIQDNLVVIRDLAVEGLDLQPMLPLISTYYHRSNGTGSLMQQAFYGTMGCNGHVDIDFRTPIYPWILDLLFC